MSNIKHSSHTKMVVIHDSDSIDVNQYNTPAYKRNVNMTISIRSDNDVIAKDNPDLPYHFIEKALLAQNEVRNNEVSRYVRRTK